LEKNKKFLRENLLEKSQIVPLVGVPVKLKSV
jgi:hypothetical protein